MPYMPVNACQNYSHRAQQAQVPFLQCSVSISASVISHAHLSGAPVVSGGAPGVGPAGGVGVGALVVEHWWPRRCSLQQLCTVVGESRRGFPSGPAHEVIHRPNMIPGPHRDHRLVIWSGTHLGKLSPGVGLLKASVVGASGAS